MRLRRRVAAPDPVPEDLVDDTGSHRAEFVAAVPSAVDHLDFRLRCTVVWHSEPAVRPFAMRAVAERARSTLRRYHPTHWQLAGIQLAADLAVPTTVRAEPQVLGYARDVAVTVDEEQLDLARQHAARQRALAEQAWAADQAELRYLKDTVFADPATAALWWMRHNEYDLARVEPTVTALRAVVRTVANADAPRWVDQLLEFVEAAVGHLPSPRKFELHEKLAALLDSFGAREQAVQVQERGRNRVTRAVD